MKVSDCVFCRYNKRGGDLVTEILSHNNNKCIIVYSGRNYLIELYLRKQIITTILL